MRCRYGRNRLRLAALIVVGLSASTLGIGAKKGQPQKEPPTQSVATRKDHRAIGRRHRTARRPATPRTAILSPRHPAPQRPQRRPQHHPPKRSGPNNSNRRTQHGRTPARRNAGASQPSPRRAPRTCPFRPARGHGDKAEAGAWMRPTAKRGHGKPAPPCRRGYAGHNEKTRARGNEINPPRLERGTKPRTLK